jgi:hypothetical protein
MHMRTSFVGLAAAAVLVAVAGVNRVVAAPIPAGLSQANAALKSAVAVRYRRRGRYFRRYRRARRGPYYAPGYAYYPYGYYPGTYHSYGYYPYRRYRYAPRPFIGLGFGPFRFGIW